MHFMCQIYQGDRHIECETEIEKWFVHGGKAKTQTKCYKTL